MAETEEFVRPNLPIHTTAAIDRQAELEIIPQHELLHLIHKTRNARKRVEEKQKDEEKQTQDENKIERER